MKKTLTSLGIVLLVGSVLGFIVYGALGGISHAPPLIRQHDQNPSYSGTPDLQVSHSNGSRLLSYMRYSEHTDYEKALIDRFLADKSELMKGYSAGYSEGTPGDFVFLAYYDDAVVVIGPGACKDACFYELGVYDLATMQKVGEKEVRVSRDVTMFDEYIINLVRDSDQEYLISYKRGDRDFRVVSGSEIDSRNETYRVGGEYDIQAAFLSPDTLTLPVFDVYKKNSYGGSVKVLRTAEFKLQ